MDPMSPSLSATAHVGRIGALAVALGVGVAVATGTGVAWADTPDSSSSTQSSSPSGSTGTGSTSGTASSSGSATSTGTTTSAATSAESNSLAQESPSANTSTRDAGKRQARRGEAFRSGGERTSSGVTGNIAERVTRAIGTAVRDENRTSTPDTDTRTAVVDPVTSPPDADTEIDDSPETNAAQPPRTPAVPATRDTANSTSPSKSRRSSVTVPDLASSVRANTVAAATDMLDEVTERSATALTPVRDAVSAPAVVPVASATPVAEPLARLAAAPQSTPAAETAQPTAPGPISGLLAAVGIAPLAANTPAAPAQPPTLWALLAYARREFERVAAPFGKASTVQPSTVAAAAVVDPLPNRLESTPIGWVTGQQNTCVPGECWDQTNNTSGFGIYGTDLGIMWDGGVWRGERFVHTAFGDTFSGPNMTGDWRSNVLLISLDDNLSDGLSLEPTGYAYQFIPGAPSALGLFGSEVTVIPTAGVQINGTQYVNYMSVKSWDTPGRWSTNYSAISMYNPATDRWVLVPSTVRSAGWFRSSTPYVPGSQNFQQAAYVLQPEDKVVEGEPRYLYAFGTPSGRAGSAYLSRVPEEAVTDLTAYEYWDGEKWVVNNPAVAAPIIGDSTHSVGLFGFVVDWANDPNVFGGNLGGLFGARTGGNVSEMSVQYNEYLDKYVVLYADGNNDIQMRIADKPEGPWSDPVTVATSAEYPGLYAPMIHPWSGTGQLTNADGTPDENNVYWNMSLWGDYNVMLLQTDLAPLQTIRV
jgi:hypothetical protein